MNIYSHTGLFSDSKYTKWYYSIISSAQSKYRSKGIGVYYERHHVLPESLFPEYKNLIKHPWNGVLLTAKEHFICHLLLTKMVIKNSVHHLKMEYALIAFGRSSNNQSRKMTSKVYSRIRTAYSITKKAHTWYNNGVEERWCSQCPLGWTKGRLSGTRFYNNGIECKQLLECPPGWVPGRLKGQNGIPNGWKWYNNGVECKMAQNCPDGWKPGQLKVKSTKGLRWFNDGTSNILATECPSGWIKGQLKRK